MLEFESQPKAESSTILRGTKLKFFAKPTNKFPLSMSEPTRTLTVNFERMKKVEYIEGSINYIF